MLYAVSGFGFTMIAITFVIIVWNFIDLKAHDEGTPEMIERAAIIRSGSKTFLRQVYKVVALVIVILAMGYAAIQEPWSGLCLMGGSILVLIASEIGMRAGTYANVRTTNAARVTRAVSRTVRIATLGGSVSGFSVAAFGLLGFTILVLLCWVEGPKNINHGLLVTSFSSNVMSARLTAYSLGFSIVAIFSRVAGGTFTKSADIGDDIVSKGEYGLEEDDPRNVCSIADLVGDCVNDLFGNLTDLGESYVATLMSCSVFAVQSFAYDMQILEKTLSFPLILAIGGLVSSVISIMYIILKNRRYYEWVILDEVLAKQKTSVISEELTKALKENITREGEHGTELRVEYSQNVADPEKELTNATLIAATLTVVIGLLGSFVIFRNTEVAGFRFGWVSPMIAALLGITSSVVVGILTSVYTDTSHGYARKIAEMAKRGPSFALSMGISVGEHSVFYPMIIIGFSVFLAFRACGFYGIAVAAVGVLSFVAETVSIDAFGPIADNAGGIAEGCGLDFEVREITDLCDASGNTTAAIGKGNAISAAAYTVISMLMSIIVLVPSFDLNNPDTFVRFVCGAIIGGAIINEFMSQLGNNTIELAVKLTLEAIRQLEIPGVMEKKIKPDYDVATKIASINAIRRMPKPSLLGAVSPLIIGAIMGPSTQIGAVFGAAIVAICGALFNGNAGGGYDNAKKMIEMGLIEGCQKHDAAHIAAVVCDTVGDIMKDVKAVCCDICIKIMAVVTIATAVFFYYHHLL